MKKEFYSLVALFSIIVQPASAQEADTFKYNPPDGTTYQESYSLTRTKEFDAVKKQTEEINGVVSYTVKKTEKGYILKALPVSFDVKRDGQTAPESITKPVLEARYALVLDQKGQFLSIDGVEDIVKKMKENMPADSPQEVMGLFTEKAVTDKEKAEYDDRIGSFIGKQFQVGQDWISQNQYTLPDGKTIDYITIGVIREKVSCGQAQCVKIDYKYNANPAELKEFIESVYKDLPEGELKKVELNGIKFSGGGKRLIDPKTMLIYAEETTRLIELPVTTPDGNQKPLVMTETKKYEYKYN